MKGKTVLVTGANSGIGKETARNLAKRGARVIMACRNLDLANQARDEIVGESGNQEVIVMKLDLSSQKSVRDFAMEFLANETRLDVLIHNAGYGNTFSKALSEDGIEFTVATNHYGPFLLTHLLIELLKNSAPSRIVVVASSFYQIVRNVGLDNLNPVNDTPWGLYYTSKGWNIMFTQELAKRLDGTGVTANCLHPGLVDTGIWRNVKGVLKMGLYVWNKLFFISSEKGAQTTIYLATSERLNGVSGKYFKDCREGILRPFIKVPENCLKLWEESVKIVKLQPSDPKI